MTVIELIEAGAKQLADAGVAFGHGTANAFDESAWLVLWKLGYALEVAKINVTQHEMAERITLLVSDGLKDLPARYDLILCNPPYVNSASMAALPAEYRAEPELALAGGTDGMDFIRGLLAAAPARMTPRAVLVLEIGNEYDNFIAAFPRLEAMGLPTSAGDDQVLLITREAIEKSA